MSRRDRPMRGFPLTHERLWLWAVHFVAVVGLVATVAMWGPWTAATIGLFVAAMCWCMLGAVAGEPGGLQPLRTGLLLAGAVTAAVGLVAAFRLAGAMLVALLVLTSPVVSSILRTGQLRWKPSEPSGPFDDGLAREQTTPGVLPAFPLPRGASTPTRTTSELPGGEHVALLDDLELCMSWRRSYVCLGGSETAHSQLAVVRLRQQYLDELVRRHPAQVGAWLAAGARAAGNPLPYIVGDLPERSREPWPDLD